jgi:hypothetical protein
MISARCKKWRRWLRARTREISEAEIRLQYDIYMTTEGMTPAELLVVTPDAAAALECSDEQFLTALKAWTEKPASEKLEVGCPDAADRSGMESR